MKKMQQAAKSYSNPGISDRDFRRAFLPKIAFLLPIFELNGVTRKS